MKNKNSSITDNDSDSTSVKIESNDGIDMDCGGCGERIKDKFLLCVGGKSWHSRCLKCCACARPLHEQRSCFLRGMRLYCRHDYAL